MLIGERDAVLLRFSFRSRIMIGLEPKLEDEREGRREFRDDRFSARRFLIVILEEEERGLLCVIDGGEGVKVCGL